ncbi:MAG: hypothetical protein ACI9OJ_001564 [Myxococcota bacterium]|jgi:hypothetical protein
MGIILGLVMIILGLLAASSLIASRSQDAGEFIEKLRPIQGGMGLAGALAGLIFLVRNLFSLGGTMKSAGLIAIVPSIGGPLVLAATGFLMGFAMISSLIASSAEAREKADDLYHTLTPYQVPLGIVSIVLGLWSIFT